MKKGLLLTSNRLINKDQIKSVYLASKALIITLNFPEEYAGGIYRLMTEESRVPETQCTDIIVPIQEIKRIQREIEQYFCVELNMVKDEVIA